MKDELPETFRKALEDYYYHLVAFPNAHIKGLIVNTDPKAESDTAFYRINDGTVTISHRLLKAIRQYAPQKEVNICKAVLSHEAWHSAYTLYWLTKMTPTQSCILNWLEDVRNNQSLHALIPNMGEDLGATMDVVKAMRKEKKAVRPEGTAGQVMDFLNQLAYRSYEVPFEASMAAIRDRSGFSEETKSWIDKMAPLIRDFYSHQPQPYESAAEHTEKSYRSICTFSKLLDLLDPLLKWEQEKKAMEGRGLSDLKKAIEDELRRREQEKGKGKGGEQQPGEGEEPGQGPGEGKGKDPGQEGEGEGQGEGQGEGEEKGEGKGQGKGQGKGKTQKGSEKGQGKGEGEQGPGDAGESPSDPADLRSVPTEVLKQMLEAIERLQEMPNDGKPLKADPIAQDGGKDVNPPRSYTDKEINKGIALTGASIAWDTPPASEATILTFTQKNMQLISQLAKQVQTAQINPFNDGRGKSQARESGTMLRIDGIIDRRMTGDPLSPLFWRRSGDDLTHGKKLSQLDSVNFMVDGLCAQCCNVPLLRYTLAIAYNVMYKAGAHPKIVASTHAAKGFEELAKGIPQERPAHVNSGLLHLVAHGNTGFDKAFNYVKSVTKRADVRRTRDIIFTDFCSTNQEAQATKAFLDESKRPILLVGINSGSYGGSYMSGLKSDFKGRAVIVYDVDKGRETDEGLLTLFTLMGEWLKDPKKFLAAHPEPAHVSQWTGRLKVPNISVPYNEKDLGRNRFQARLVAPLLAAAAAAHPPACTCPSCQVLPEL